VSICVKDLELMHKFYEEVIGLEIMRREENYAFLKIAEG
jgi:catechol-2,3-dioxygenase